MRTDVIITIVFFVLCMGMGFFAGFRDGWEIWKSITFGVILFVIDIIASLTVYYIIQQIK